MPTREVLESFWRDWDGLTPEQQRQFRQAVAKFVHDLGHGRGIRAGLRVKRVESAEGIFELTWARDGRATFEFGKPIQPGDTHIRWRRIGTHEILDRP